MWTIKRRSVAEYKGLFSRPPDTGQIKIIVKFLSYPAQEYRRGMFTFYDYGIFIYPFLTRVP